MIILRLGHIHFARWGDSHRILNKDAEQIERLT